MYDVGKDGAVPALRPEQLVGSLAKGVDVTVSTYEFSNVPSQCLSFPDILRLADVIEDVARREKPDGFVVTMGTNIMEEISYVLELLLALKEAIVVTGAMRNKSLPGSDVDSNLHDAIVAASSESMKGKGVVVVMNREIHHSIYVTKSHTTSLASFRSDNTGPMGVIRGERVVLYANPARRDHIRPKSISARVDLIKYCMGMDGSLLEAAVKLGAKGIVLEAFGGGNLMPATIPAIEGAIIQGIPVILASRCWSGELLENTYGFEGSETHLRKLGVIFASGLSGVKARIRLILALSAGFTDREIANLFIT